MEERRVVMCSKLTMKVLAEYDSLEAAAAGNGELVATIRHRCKYRAVGRGGVVFRYADDYDPKETFEGKPNRPVAVADCKTKQVAFFCGLTEASAALDVSRKNLKRSMSEDRPIAGRYILRFVR